MELWDEGGLLVGARTPIWIFQMFIPLLPFCRLVTAAGVKYACDAAEVGIKDKQDSVVLVLGRGFLTNQLETWMFIVIVARGMYFWI